MKARGIVVIDYELPGGFIEAAEEQKKLQEAVQDLVKGNPRVVFSEVDIRERRGDQKPNLAKMKIRLG